MDQQGKGQTSTEVVEGQLPWPDPKVLEAYCREYSPDKKSTPSSMILSELTYREILMGPPSILWRGLVEERPSKDGMRKYLMGMTVIIRETPKRTIQLVWDTDNGQVTHPYKWPAVNSEILAAWAHKFGKSLLKAQEEELLYTKSLACSPDATYTILTALDSWQNEIRKQALIKQRLITVCQYAKKLPIKQSNDSEEVDDTKTSTPNAAVSKPPPVVRSST